MLAVFTKPIELVTAADIVELYAQTWPEGYEVDFKEALPDRRGGQHPWFTGGDIGDHARDEILSQVIAFANAQGSSVVLGIEEASDKPPRARAVIALPRNVVASRASKRPLRNGATLSTNGREAKNRR